MNKFFLLVAIAATTLSHTVFAQDTAKAPQLLSHYYALKDALVSGNSSQAASHAEAFQKTASSIDPKTGSEGNLSTLIKDAGKISTTKDLKKQREYFASFSTGMTTLAKAVKLSDKPVYLAYCPMKKAAWLTSSKAIKNPYYGSSMLTCGEITETIQ
jgi:DNA-binding transcriptional regulator WhiA